MMQSVLHMHLGESWSITCMFNLNFSSKNLFLFLDAQNGVSPLYAACQKGHSNIVDILVEAGADVEATTVVKQQLY